MVFVLGDDSGGTFGGLDRGSTVYIKVERNKALWTLLFRPGIKIVLHSEMENIFFFLARGPLTMCPNRYISDPFVFFFGSRVKVVYGSHKKDRLFSRRNTRTLL